MVVVVVLLEEDVDLMRTRRRSAYPAGVADSSTIDEVLDRHGNKRLRSRFRRGQRQRKR